ncbi:diguanylate cyclase (GGDEF)-like protein [Chitinivorax tropicus]|uniref:Diguanylate cyclase (GGDEF)-like protein n=1 Tax=Chitinivorax tropicus TaxID=714531 RepID=A0A840MSL8_9PROT|nr:EAL domain-containing protein [Chitinivorax tropicus]MBB5018211.1 diguanylate cyclase (GGDEF)-like protein [Chitinivorax tropicus]
MSQDDELLHFVDELDVQVEVADRKNAWQVLIVDDDKEVHHVTTFALRDAIIQNRPLNFLHAYSAGEAEQILIKHQNIAVILLDVVMEKENAGLDLVKIIRDKLGQHDVRIVLRTGQPGYAPELSAIRDYDINDYKTKSELTLTRLLTTMTTALRSYEQLKTIAAGQRGLDRIVHAAPDLFARRTMDSFTEGVINQLSALLEETPEGLVCVQQHSEGETIVNATGPQSRWIGQPLDTLPQADIRDLIARCLHTQAHVHDQYAIALYFCSRAGDRMVVYLPVHRQLAQIDLKLLEVFCTNIAVGFESVELFQQLHDFAFSDILCKIPNRAGLLQIIDDHRQSGHCEGYLIALVDIDHFSEINDALGHENGDRLLKAISHRLRSALGANCKLARINADTFGIYGPESDIRPDALLTLFSPPFEVSNYDLRVGGTIGLVRLDVIDGNGLVALKCASIALNRAKNDQRGQYCYYTTEMEQDTRQRLTLLHDLRAAIDARKLKLFYQPQISLHDGRPVGAEALIRWPVDTGAFIPPDQFIGLAEYSGMIIELGDWVMRVACEQAQQWTELGFPWMRIAVNVSVVQFRNPDFVASVDRVLKETRIEPARLELEITESVAMQGAANVEPILQQLKALGVTLAIDDFGTGFSSLSYLQRLPVDRLKIDRAFVRDMGTQSERSSIADMIVRLGHELGLTVIAEGVESPQHVNALKQIGCEEAQGFYYSRPLPANDFLAWLAPFKM